jgi:A/G-specific adenine glycosylase
MNFSKILITWYLGNGRKLPWRGIIDPYKIWISEIILQQTRVIQGMSYYQKFMKKYPLLRALANASEQDVLKSWQGLGYYSRALNMHKTAKLIENEMDGIFPKSYNKLLELPGVGPYSAAAIASFAYGEKVPVLDGNVYRFTSRFWGLKEPINTASSRKIFTEKLNSVMPNNDAANFNQGIMEIGSLVCTPRKPKCNECPFQSECVAYSTGSQMEFPVKPPKTKRRTEYHYYLNISRPGKTIIRKRDNKSIWKNLFELPSIISTTPLEHRELQQETKAKFGVEISEKEFRASTEISHELSHIKIKACFIKISKIDDFYLRKNDIFEVAESEVDTYPFHRLITKYFESE